MALTAVRSRRWRLAGIAAAVVAVGLLTLAMQRAAVLTWVGSLLVAEDPLVRADVVIPLAGGDWDREIEAADLFRAGYAATLLLTREPDLPTAAYLKSRGIEFPTSHETRIRVLTALGVPHDRIAAIDEPVTSTRDEARFVADWARQRGARTIIVVTSRYHTARSKYIFERHAGAGGIRIVVRPATLGAFRPETWWTTRGMLREGIFELQKFAAYRIRY